MLTLFIHILEVLAMSNEGVTIAKIVDMGSEYTKSKVGAALKSMEAEGYVLVDRGGKTNVYVITEKALEYCGMIVRKYGEAHILEDVSGYVDTSTPRDETVVDIMLEEQPERIHKVWTPRKTLVIQAAHHMKRYSIANSHLAIESVIQGWEQNKINARAVQYYGGLSHQGLLRLITDVKNYRA